MITNDRPQPISFVPTAFFAEFLASAREGFDSQLHYEVLRRVSETDRTTSTGETAGNKVSVS